MIVGAWTAYETLATDLWVNSVNERPMSLGVNALLAKSEEGKPGGDRGDTQGKEPKYTQTSLDILK
jgi:hypothetical protein